MHYALLQQHRISQTPPPMSAAASTNHQKDDGSTRESMITSPAQIAIIPHRLKPFLRIKTRPLVFTHLSISERASNYDCLSVRLDFPGLLLSRASFRPPALFLPAGRCPIPPLSPLPHRLSRDVILIRCLFYAVMLQIQHHPLTKVRVLCYPFHCRESFL